jgi:hypothetical protein
MPFIKAIKANSLNVDSNRVDQDRYLRQLVMTLSMTFTPQDYGYVCKIKVQAKLVM